MVAPHVDREVIWRRVNTHLEELALLEDELRRLTEAVNAKRRFVEQLTGFSGSALEAKLHGEPEANGSASAPRPARRRVARKQGTVRQWVLQSIAHYQDANPQSRIDERSIQIYINAEAPGFLEQHNSNVLSTALHVLHKDGLISRFKKAGQTRFQFSLTSAGREQLA